ncbi:MAG: HlyD family efflux transporter periplasmic adaptor subunit [Bacteroidetes bacterium]|nr:MAG: HlyD family efflux transporter periplasmic adaptor subunit [Bacteroidota bacterium]
MLNISPYKIDRRIDAEKLSSLKEVESKQTKGTLITFVKILVTLILLILFLPWTQNIQSTGFLTTINPAQRPQNINSIIPGKIKKWYVKEGDLVKKGDTLVAIEEIKVDYLDPNLIDRVKQQIQSKEGSVKSYMQKVNALDEQIDALISEKFNKLDQLKLKLRQAKMQLVSDSMEYETQKINVTIAAAQFKRMEELYLKGLKSKTDFEKRKMTLQKAQAVLTEKENKFLKSKAELDVIKTEMRTFKAYYDKMIAKAESEKYATLSMLYNSEADLTKLQNQFSSYVIRSGFYYIKAPQNGYITHLSKAGIGEILKEGELLLTIVPEQYDFAVASYIRPVDLPLVHKGEKVRLQFDGWPAIVFSGWPNISYGTYGGEIYAIDKYISPNGKFRILIKPDTTDQKWPDKLSVGGGAKTIILLKDVPVWYEIWRQLNSFPPDYYTPENKQKSAKAENK